MEKRSENREDKFEIPSKTLQDIKTQTKNHPLKWRRFSIEQINFALRTSPSRDDSGDQNGQPAEYIHQPNEVAIYIWEDLPEKIQRVLLFHEIIEVYLRQTYGLDKTPAHTITLTYEDQFRKEILSDKEEKALKELRDRYSEKLK